MKTTVLQESITIPETDEERENAKNDSREGLRKSCEDIISTLDEDPTVRPESFVVLAFWEVNKEGEVGVTMRSAGFVDDTIRLLDMGQLDIILQLLSEDGNNANQTAELMARLNHILKVTHLPRVVVEDALMRAARKNPARFHKLMEATATGDRDKSAPLSVH
jgi:hypothetical protein